MVLFWRQWDGVDPITKAIGLLAGAGINLSFISQLLALAFVTLTLFTSLRSLLHNLNRVSF